MLQIAQRDPLEVFSEDSAPTCVPLSGEDSGPMICILPVGIAIRSLGKNPSGRR
jgi:hypothetical protein